MIIKRYLAHKIYYSVSFITFIICVIVVTFESLKLLVILVNGAVTFKQYLFMALSLLPYFIATTLPLSSFVGTLHALYTTFRNKELTIVRGIGLSNMTILFITLRVGVIIFIIATALNAFLTPVGMHAFKVMQFRSKNVFIASHIPEGKFTPIDNNTTIFARKIRIPEIYGILIYQKRHNPNSLIVATAKKGILITNEIQKKETHIVLYNGVQQLKTKNNRQIITFKRYAINIKIPLHDYKYTKEIDELTSLTLAKKLWKHTATPEEKSEFYKRFLSASINILTVLIASLCVLITSDQRTPRPHTLLIGSAVAFFVVTLTHIFIVSSSTIGILFWVIMWIVSLGSMGIVCATWYADRKK